MQYTPAILLTVFTATQIAAHGVITEVQGANGMIPKTFRKSTDKN